VPRKVANRQRDREEAELDDGVGDGAGDASILHQLQQGTWILLSLLQEGTWIIE
jgi:hypothetical protein